MGRVGRCRRSTSGVCGGGVVGVLLVFVCTCTTNAMLTVCRCLFVNSDRYRWYEGKMPRWFFPGATDIAGDGLCGYRSLAWYMFRDTTNSHVLEVVAAVCGTTQGQDRILHHTVRCL